MVAVAAGGALLAAGVANAAPQPGTLGTLTFTPATGSDLTIPTARTSGPCPTTASAANMEVTGPVGAATQTFPPNNPFPIRTTETTSFSTTAAFNIAAGRDLKNAADSRGTQLAAGEYDFTVHCVDQFILTDFGTFTGAIYFTSPTAWQTNNPNAIPTATTLTTSPVGSANQGDPVTLNAAVSPNTAAGSVQFKDGANNIGAAVPVANGAASTTTSTLSPGAHQLTAVFTPTDPAAFNGSTSSAVTFTVNTPAQNTTTALGVTPASPAPSGATETLTATVTPSAAVGSVQFKDGTTNIGAAVPVSGGTAVGTTVLPDGSHSLTAVFTPTNPANFTGSTSPAVTYVVNGAAVTTSTVLGVTPASPAPAGTVETLKATVTPSAAVGSVQFVDGTTNIGAAVPVAGGTAQTTTTLASGSHSLTAVFTPTNPANFTGSTSPAVTYVVNATGAKVTTTTLTVFPDSLFPNITFSQNIPRLLLADVSPHDATGTVQFMDGTKKLGSPMPVRNGFAFLVTRDLKQGTHSLTAVFTPTDPKAFQPSTSQAVIIKVGPPRDDDRAREQAMTQAEQLIQTVHDGMNP
ncbi:MAG TPA: Ig-like domain-containing protein [Pseudonocardiaceae bacterium]